MTAGEMPKRDPYPESFELEMDRAALCRYWRWGSVLVLGVIFCFFGGLFGLMFAGIFFESHPALTANARIGYGLLFGISGVAGGLLLTTIVYCVLAHYPLKRAADNLRILVEGPYLRIISGAYYPSDTRIHFRSISHYSLSDGPLLRRFGLRILSFSIAGSMRNAGWQIPGLKNPDQVRNQLCEIDAAREL